MLLMGQWHTLLETDHAKESVTGTTPRQVLAALALLREHPNPAHFSILVPVCLYASHLLRSSFSCLLCFSILVEIAIQNQVIKHGESGLFLGTSPLFV